MSNMPDLDGAKVRIILDSTAALFDDKSRFDLFLSCVERLSIQVAAIGLDDVFRRR